MLALFIDIIFGAMINHFYGPILIKNWCKICIGNSIIMNIKKNIYATIQTLNH